MPQQARDKKRKEQSIDTRQEGRKAGGLNTVSQLGCSEGIEKRREKTSLHAGSAAKDDCQLVFVS